MRISVVIPVFEDRAELLDRVGQLAEADELIVVDASRADPVRVGDLPEGAQLIRTATANRASQENLGAEAASGQGVLFLHADTAMPAGALEQIRGALADPEVVGGGFERRFDSGSRLLRWTCRLAGWRSRRWGWFLGDQAIFVRRDLFERLGGFALLTAFEDYDLCRRLKREGKLRCLAPPVLSSARRFEREGEGEWMRSLKDLALTIEYLVRGTKPFRAI